VARSTTTWAVDSTAVRNAVAPSPGTAAAASVRRVPAGTDSGWDTTAPPSVTNVKVSAAEAPEGFTTRK
jgi:hypothetical protein